MDGLHYSQLFIPNHYLEGLIERRTMGKVRQNESGFTLVELLITIAVFGIIFTSVLKVFHIHHYAYSVQVEVAAMQQNLRSAKMFIETDVRMAGCGLRNFSHDDERVYALNFENANGATGSDKLTVTYIDYSNTACDGLLPQLTLAAEMPESSSEAEVNEDLETAPYSAWDEEFTCNGSTYGGTPFVAFKAIVTAPDGTRSDVLYVTTVQANSSKLQNRPYDGFNNTVLNTYPSGSIISLFNEDKLTELSYYVVDGVLYRNSESIAENIEDLQFAFGLDTNGDGTVDSWIKDADLTNTQKDQVRSVRINVLGRTGKADNNFSGSRPAIEDHAASGTGDGYRRKLLQVTVKVRNLGL